MLHSVFVYRRSYNQDLLFQIQSITHDGIARLYGNLHRITADAPVSDLIIASSGKTPDSVLLQDWYTQYRQRSAHLLHHIRYPIRVLHLDSDPRYLNLCLRCYQLMHLQASGIVLEEQRQPLHVTSLLHRHKPNILILTGHDALPKHKDPQILSNYKSSGFFAEAVSLAREYEPHPDRLVIYAGACQSYYEKILEAGANFAASPGRIFIHAMDPVIVCETLTLTPISQILHAEDITRYTYSGSQGIGGFSTYGLCRLA